MTAPGRVLAVAVAAVADEPAALRSAVDRAARHAVAERRGLTVVATVGTSRLMQAMAAAAPMALPAVSEAALQAQAERHVRRILASATRDVSLLWRCSAQLTRCTLERELYATPYALVVIGCRDTRRSRWLARRLARAVERCGSSATVAVTRPEAGVPEVILRPALQQTGAPTVRFT